MARGTHPIPSDFVMTQAPSGLVRLSNCAAVPAGLNLARVVLTQTVQPLGNLFLSLHGL